jgi:hypothetical protein
MKLYEVLKEKELVKDYKDFVELISIRALRINDKPVVDPNHEIFDYHAKVKIGILTVDLSDL